MMAAVRKETEEFIDTLMVHHFSEEGIRKAFSAKSVREGDALWQKQVEKRPVLSVMTCTKDFPARFRKWIIPWKE